MSEDFCETEEVTKSGLDKSNIKIVSSVLSQCLEQFPISCLLTMKKKSNNVTRTMCTYMTYNVGGLVGFSLQPL
jgi:hypothetical protein